MKAMRKCMFFLMLLVYAGQSLAGVMLSCPPMAMDTMDMAAHAGHDMSAHGDDGSEQQSCCDGGLCVMSQCHAAPALPQTMSLPAGVDASSLDTPLVLSSLLHRSDTLFRPPIFS